MFNRQSMRLQDYDYTQSGIYFVTLCTYRYARLFGHIVDGNMQLSELGQLVEQEWQRTAEVRTTVEIDMYVVMPNHLHGLLFMSESQAGHGAKSSMTMQANSLGSIIAQFKSIVTKRSRELIDPPRFPIWKRNYYDHVVRNEKDLDRIRRYIIANPARWREDQYYSD